MLTYSKSFTHSHLLTHSKSHSLIHSLPHSLALYICRYLRGQAIYADSKETGKFGATIFSIGSAEVGITFILYVTFSTTSMCNCVEPVCMKETGTIYLIATFFSSDIYFY